MIKEIIENLENLSRLTKSSQDVQKVQAEILKTRSLIQSCKLNQNVNLNGQLPSLEKLDFELSTWQSKLDVIFREPIGRQGMAKHAHFWAEELRKMYGR